MASTPEEDALREIKSLCESVRTCSSAVSFAEQDLAETILEILEKVL